MRLIREAGLYVLTAVAVYLFLLLWTYHPADPGWSHSGGARAPLNYGGPVGAWLADVLLHLFGYVAYLFPLMAATAAVRLFLNRKRSDPPDLRHQLVTAIGFVLTLVGAGGLAQLHFTHLPPGLPFTSGGMFGAFVGGALTAAFSFVGATVFLLALFLAGVTLFTGLSWMRLMDGVGRLGFEGFGRARFGLSVALDYFIGLRAVRARRETVAKDKRVLEKHTPPRIEPLIQPPPKSTRLEREKQVPLFEPVVSGELPQLSLLDAPRERKLTFSKQSLETMSRLVEKKLLDFDIEVQVVAVHPGPVITRFELETSPGTKASQITNLAKDLARALSVVSLRVVENIPGKSVVGLEIPNEEREIVRLSEGLSSQAYEDVNSPLALALGKDIGGNPVVVDLVKMPHLLIAGTTGSGKSVCIHALILSLVYKSTPEQVRLLMVDPKMLELAVYEGIPHLLAPVVTDMKQAANALRWSIKEMDRRYRLMAALGVRNISGYNNKVKEADKAGKPLLDPLATPIDGEPAAALKTLPYVVIVIDELADLMMVVGKKVEELITRLAQKARAAGLHLIVATQRPSVDVITGLIKANIPTRIAFQVSSRVDSRTVLDQIGAEQLLGHGDMLFLAPGSGVPLRVHGAFVADDEVHKVVSFLRKSGRPSYHESILQGGADDGAGGAAEFGGEPGLGGEADPLYDEALKIVTESRRASISSVQRRLRIGYNRAARLIEEMEKSGVVGPVQSNGSREVLAPPPPPRS
ncbi:MAG: DNA translocase FtsK 4TM domain-containing protein [Gammaproteobacteria bacterium]|nr:DNA translocase FtsK 4TM domain-containing protein [Gammaproteobacteria bacterium]